MARPLLLLTAAATILGIGLYLNALPSGHEPAAEPVVHELPITREEATLRVRYCGNGDLAADPATRRLVVVIHGDARNACEYASWTIAAAHAAGALDETLVVAPHFLSDSDDEARREDTLYWTSGGWKTGSLSRMEPYDRPWQLSSFAVVDEIIEQAQQNVPSLEEVVVAGHSAGGQLVQRYAAATRISGPVRFVVANPSSYLYLDDRRWQDSELRDLDGDELEACPTYDEYKYGLNERFGYFGELSRSDIRGRYGVRRVDYLLGADDTDQEGGNIDESCEAAWQGRHRLERGLFFVAALGELYGDEVYDRHRLTIVPDVGHDAEDMLLNPEGQDALFGR